MCVPLQDKLGKFPGAKGSKAGPTLTKSVTEVALSGAAVAATPHLGHGMGSLATERMSLTNMAGLSSLNVKHAVRCQGPGGKSSEDSRCGQHARACHAAAC